MSILLLILGMSVGLSEQIEAQLPQDAETVYTMSVDVRGVPVEIEWQDRSIVATRICRSAAKGELSECQQAALSWMRSECHYYSQQAELTAKQVDMEEAVCTGAYEYEQIVNSIQLADN